MSATGSAPRPSQRSSSSTRSSRRATMSVGPGGGLSNVGSLSPQRVLRTKALRERSNEGNGNPGSDPNTTAGVKAKPASKGASRVQRMQFAFGSKIVKPGPSKTGVGSTAGDARSKTQGGAVADGGSNAPIRPRRERASLHEPHHEHQQRVTPRGRSATNAQHQPTRKETDADALKAQLAEKEAVIADLKSKLEKASAAEVDASGSKESHETLVAAKQIEVDEGAQVALGAVVEEARAEAEEALNRVETVNEATLSKAKEMQTGVDEMMANLAPRGTTRKMVNHIALG
eukprot:jgi/Undpi1/6650/HiC_scaffold_20.g09129.m1